MRIDWETYTELLKIKYHFSATTKRTSMSLGSQAGWKTDTSNAPN